MNNPDSSYVAERSGESVFSHSTNLQMPLLRNPATSQRMAKTTEPIRTAFAPPSSSLLRPSGQILMNQNALSRQLTTFPVQSRRNYTQANIHIGNFITTTAASENCNISPLHRSYFDKMGEPSLFPNAYLYSPVIDGLPINLQRAGNPSFPMPVTADTSAASPLRSSPPPPLSEVHHCNYN